jgi:hypothetical protein
MASFCGEKEATLKKAKTIEIITAILLNLLKKKYTMKQVSVKTKPIWYLSAKLKGTE